MWKLIVASISPEAKEKEEKRQRRNEAARKFRKKHKKLIAAKKRARYRTDAVFREARKKESREAYMKNLLKGAK